MKVVSNAENTIQICMRFPVWAY